jgi:Family of unknown function (DUF6325)
MEESTTRSGESPHGPVDFVLIEFEGERLTGAAAQALLDLVDRGIVNVYDVMVIGRDEAGTVHRLDLSADESAELGEFTKLAWARSGLLTEDDAQEAAKAMQPGTLAVLIVYENTWAVPFVAAVMESGGELIAGARIPAPAVMDALDALEASGAPESRQLVAATPVGG